MDSFPLENLPIEIVIDIFDEACQNYRDAVLASVESELEVPCPYEKRHCRKKPLVTPVSLSQVCRIWKEVVFSTPKLWDTIHLVVDTRKYGDDKEMYMKCSMLLKKWLQRTGAVPLTMIIGEYAVACKEYGDGSIMEQIIERIGQCKFLSMHCPKEEFERLQAALKNPLPLLTAFLLKRCCRYTSGFNPTSITITAPNLSRILMYSSLPLQVSLAGITVFYCQSIELGVIVGCLRSMDQLIDCTIEYPELKLCLPPHCSLQLSVLEKFSLECWREDMICEWIIKNISLPAVQKFCIQGLYQHSSTGSGVKDVISLIQRSKLPPIKELKIDAEGFAVITELLDLLSITPNLTKLELFFNNFIPSDNDIERIITLSHLTTLCIDYFRSQKGKLNVKCLRLPVLKNLSVLIKEDPALSLYVDTLSSMILHANTLRTLTLTAINDDLPEVELLRLLKSAQSIEHLNILIALNYEVMDFDPELLLTAGLFELLLPSSSNLITDRDSTAEVYLPRLTEISLEGLLVDCGRVMIDALEYRWKGDQARGVQKLASARIFATGCTALLKDNAVSQRVHSLRQQGMDLEFGEYWIK